MLIFLVMRYSESLPDNQFSHHVESYWNVISEMNSNAAEPLEMFLPTCTFNIIFINAPCYVTSNLKRKWILLNPGAAFIGQTNTSLYFKSKRALNIKGIRFKPFAFANLISNPLFYFNDSIIELEKLFPLNKKSELLIHKIKKDNKFGVQEEFLNEFTHLLLSKKMSLDEGLRAQLNFIMERHGIMRIMELSEEFNISKVTLHKHFVKKVGLTPKKVSQIWRMNRLLQLKEEFPDKNLTTVSLEAGFYDQAHFIKDFKSIFEITPKKFFDQKSNLISIANLNISRRFTNQYDPRVN